MPWPRCSPAVLRQGKPVTSTSRLCAPPLSKLSPSPPSPIQRLFSKYTLSSIGDIGFGVDLGLFKDGREYDVPFETSFDEATSLSGERWTRPFWAWEKWLGLSQEMQLKAALQVIDEFSRDVIAKRRQLPREVLQGRCDLVTSPPSPCMPSS
jgi:hypothetical protein